MDFSDDLRNTLSRGFSERTMLSIIDIWTICKVYKGIYEPKQPTLNVFTLFSCENIIVIISISPAGAFPPMETGPQGSADASPPPETGPQGSADASPPLETGPQGSADASPPMETGPQDVTSPEHAGK